MRESVTVDKSFQFAIRIIELHKALVSKKEFILSRQILRSGTSIGAQLAESEYAQSRPDFIHKFSLAAKEASETNYWLRLLYQSGYLEQEIFQSLKSDCDELLRLTTTSLKTAKSNFKMKWIPTIPYSLFLQNWFIFHFSFPILLKRWWPVIINELPHPHSPHPQSSGTAYCCAPSSGLWADL